MTTRLGCRPRFIARRVNGDPVASVGDQGGIVPALPWEPLASNHALRCVDPVAPARERPFARQEASAACNPAGRCHSNTFEPADMAAARSAGISVMVILQFDHNGLIARPGSRRYGHSAI